MIKNNKQDITLNCLECHEDFTFTAGEQDYFAKKGLYPPKRCPVCRLKRKQEAENGKTTN